MQSLAGPSGPRFAPQPDSSQKPSFLLCVYARFLIWEKASCIPAMRGRRFSPNLPVRKSVDR